MISGLIKHINTSDYKGSKFMENEVYYETNLELETSNPDHETSNLKHRT